MPKSAVPKTGAATAATSKKAAAGAKLYQAKVKIPLNMNDNAEEQQVDETVVLEAVNIALVAPIDMAVASSNGSTAVVEKTKGKRRPKKAVDTEKTDAQEKVTDQAAGNIEKEETTNGEVGTKTKKRKAPAVTAPKGTDNEGKPEEPEDDTQASPEKIIKTTKAKKGKGATEAAGKTSSKAPSKSTKASKAAPVDNNLGNDGSALPKKAKVHSKGTKATKAAPVDTNMGNDGSASPKKAKAPSKSTKASKATPVDKNLGNDGNASPKKDGRPKTKTVKKPAGKTTSTLSGSRPQRNASVAAASKIAGNFEKPPRAPKAQKTT